MIDVTSVSEEEYVQAVDDYRGWCTHCKEFTRDMTEGDAEGYDCPKCDQNTVVGAENALIMGLIDFGEDDAK
jgi:Zn finger protein HypA/HybF involved in hydrogenase expression